MKAGLEKMRCSFHLFLSIVSLVVAGAVYASEEHNARPLNVPELLNEQKSQPEMQDISYSLEELGYGDDLKLRGVNGSYIIPLTYRRNLELLSAQLELRYDHSKELLDGLSHVNVRIDGKHVATIPIKQEEAEQLLTTNVTLPADWITPQSFLDLQLIGHYTNQCENPRHPGLWLNISNASTLKLTGHTKSLKPLLDELPAPFFNNRSFTQLELPFVLPVNPSPALLEAAGIVSSWFGALADYRGARFPVLGNKVPESGNAVLIATAENTYDSLALPALSGPQVMVVQNPNDPAGSLLVIRGKNEAEAKQAAQALVLGYKALTGQIANITGFELPEPRSPYDAPNWLASDRPVELGNLRRPQSMQVNGFSPDTIRVGMRLPPDLYDPDGAGAVINLIYHYSTRPKSDNSRILSRVNGVLIGTVELEPARNPESIANHLQDALNARSYTEQLSTQLSLPVNTLASQTELQVYFDYQYLSRENCKDVPAESVMGRIDPNSTIDISHLAHFIAMPNMAAFANSGFPFTRLADLSETVVVLPDQPNLDEQAAYLNVLGQMGASTGYPATRVQVSFPQKNINLPDKDILAISGSGTENILGDWARHLPANELLKNAGEHDSLPLWQRLLRAFDLQAEVEAQTANSHALVAGFESPSSAGRSVVVLTANNSSNLHYFSDAVRTPKLLEQVSGSSVGFSADRVHTLATDTNYYLGNLSLLRKTVWYLEHHPLTLVVIALATAVVLGFILYAALRSRALRRLQE